jgi:MGT family glycosyltransferase
MRTGVFLNLPAYGHINPTLPIVAELTRRGECIIYYATEKFRQPIEASGATFHPYTNLPDVESLGQITKNPVTLAATLAHASERVLPALLEELGDLQPDYLIHDSMCGWGAQAAAKLDMPTVNGSAVFAFGGPPPSLRFVLRNLWVVLTALPDLMDYQRTQRRIHERWGVPALSLGEMFTNTQALNIVYTSRAFQPKGEQYDDSYVFVGPTVGPRPTPETDLPLEAFAERTLIYASLGTILNEDAGFFNACMDAFAGTDYAVVIATGPDADLNGVRTPPPNVWLRGYVPQLSVLQVSDAFITHGGMNSTHEGLRYGVPLLVVPQTTEQSLVAERVTHFQAGRSLAPGRVTAQRLYNEVTTLLSDPTYARNARRLGESFRQAGGYQRAAEEILSYVAAKTNT